MSENVTEHVVEAVKVAVGVLVELRNTVAECVAESLRAVDDDSLMDVDRVDRTVGSCDMVSVVVSETLPGDTVTWYDPLLEMLSNTDAEAELDRVLESDKRFDEVRAKDRDFVAEAPLLDADSVAVLLVVKSTVDDKVGDALVEEDKLDEVLGVTDCDLPSVELCIDNEHVVVPVTECVADVLPDGDPVSRVVSLVLHDELKESDSVIEMVLGVVVLSEADGVCTLNVTFKELVGSLWEADGVGEMLLVSVREGDGEQVVDVVGVVVLVLECVPGLLNDGVKVSDTSFVHDLVPDDEVEIEPEVLLDIDDDDEKRVFEKLRVAEEETVTEVVREIVCDCVTESELELLNVTDDVASLFVCDTVPLLDVELLTLQETEGDVVPVIDCDVEWTGEG